MGTAGDPLGDTVSSLGWWHRENVWHRWWGQSRVLGTHSGVGDTHVTRAMGTFTGSEFMQRCWGHVGTQMWHVLWGHAEVLGTVTDGGDMRVALVMGTLKWWELVQVLGTHG